MRYGGFNVDRRTGTVVTIGLLFALSGIGGIATGGVAAQTGWVLLTLGLVLAALGWERRNP